MIYDINATFYQNFYAGPTLPEPLPTVKAIALERWQTVLGYPIMLPCGIAACPIMTSRGIAKLSRMGFGLFTYKTIRSGAYPAHPWPHICYLTDTTSIQGSDIGGIVIGQKEAAGSCSAIANSFGNACFALSTMQDDIAASRTYMQLGQLLIVSVFGEPSKCRSVIADFVYTAQAAAEAGAQAIEINLSCPNLGSHMPLYTDIARAAAITNAVVNAVALPVVVKIGYATDNIFLKELVCALARAGARGIAGINSIQMQIVDTKDRPYFGVGRRYAGVSGDPIRVRALDFVQKVAKIIADENLPLDILATGGITNVGHIDDFFSAGATAAMSATGAMCNPYIAYEYQCMKE